MELPVNLNPSLTLLSIFLAAGVAGYAFRESIAAAFKRRQPPSSLDFTTTPEGFKMTYERFENGAHIVDVRNVAFVPVDPLRLRVDIQGYKLLARPSTLESAQARLADIRAEKGAAEAGLEKTLLVIREVHLASSSLDAMDFYRRTRGQYRASSAKSSDNEGGQP